MRRGAARRGGGGACFFCRRKGSRAALGRYRATSSVVLRRDGFQSLAPEECAAKTALRVRSTFVPSLRLRLANWVVNCSCPSAQMAPIVCYCFSLSIGTTRFGAKKQESRLAVLASANNTLGADSGRARALTRETTAIQQHTALMIATLHVLLRARAAQPKALAHECVSRPSRVCFVFSSCACPTPRSNSKHRRADCFLSDSFCVGAKPNALNTKPRSCACRSPFWQHTPHNSCARTTPWACCRSCCAQRPRPRGRAATAAA